MEDLEHLDRACKFGQEAAMQLHDETEDEAKKQYYTGVYMAYAAVRNWVRLLKKLRGDAK